ncbi:MAG: LysR family transcriptional regulator, partial [Pseudomonadota bacterium]
DWSLVQSFLAVAETGSLSKAATGLGQSQPTLGRHIRALEDSLGLQLFDRHRRGLRLTAAGLQLLPGAEAMRADAHRLSLAAETQSNQLSGTVRIACSIFAAHHVLPPVLAPVRLAAPGIALVVQPSDESENLTFREADIALRMYRPRQLDLVARHLGVVRMGVFAAQSYAARHPLPQTVAELLTHNMVGYDRSTLIIDAMSALGIEVTADNFAVRCDNQSAYWELVRAGLGIGFTQAHVGRADPEMVEIAPLDMDLPSLPIWLTSQEAVRHIPRVDRIWTLLSETLGAKLDHINVAHPQAPGGSAQISRA